MSGRELTIDYRPLDSLVPYARNARTHSEAQVAEIAGSIREFGFTNPVLIAEDGTLIAGHGRVLAARLLGMDAVPAIALTGLSETQRRALVLADNRIALNAGWDETLLALELSDLKEAGVDLGILGFEDGELDRLLAGVEDDGDGATPPVVIPEPPRNPVSRTGDLWILGDHRLHCGDSTNHDDVRRLMNGERAVLFATDPPYLVDYDGANHPTRNKDWSASYGTTWDDSSQGAELYENFIGAAVAEAITEDAAWYCWHASRRQAMLEECWEKAGAFVHQQIIWVKDRGVLTRSHYLWKHEPCLMGWRRPNRPPKVADQTLPSTWEMPSFAREDRPDHPTPKPLDAFGIPMRQHVARGGLCYEPFCGSGSQIMAGEANGRRVFAMEISPAYVDVAVERWQAETGKDAVLDGDGRSFAQVRTERLAPETSGATIAAEMERLGRLLAGRECYGGLDLARVNDLSAFVLLFPPTRDPTLGNLADKWVVLSRFWVPEEDIGRRARRDRVPYDVWRDQGFLTATPGNATDFAFIEAEIVDLAGRFGLRELAYDRTFAGEIVQHLQDEGINLVQFGQGFLSMAAPTAELERLAVSRLLWHGGHPVLRWNASNVAVRHDPAGNIKPDKERSSERIDGIVALCNALGRAMMRDDTAGRSVYQARGPMLL